MPCNIIKHTAARSEPSIAAVGLCGGDPEKLFELAFASMIIARGSDSRATDPIAKDCMTTAFVALSELLGFSGEARQ